MHVYELNIDGLVGPTHHYAGLAIGNLASQHHALTCANPQQAALQGLAKMRLLHQLGMKQAILPPHQRPNLHLLHQLGFTGSPIEQINKAARIAPTLLSACYSASSMWAANAATVSPSSDCHDKRVHFTAANLLSNLHRHQEADFSRILLARLFAHPDHFHHHPLLPRSIITSDEGAANHSRLCAKYKESGVHLFVYGKHALRTTANTTPVNYPARQTYEASCAIARAHGLNPHQVVFACQRPDVIDQGVFHNDVIAVANESLLLLHEHAFVNQTDILAQLQERAAFPLHIIEIPNTRLTVAEAVSTYLFNSQIVTLPNQSMLLIAPIECQKHPKTQALINEFINDDANPISDVHFLDLKQSMQNGGGPACLRLRVPLNEQELNAMHLGVVVNNHLLDQLETWVIDHYRTRLHATDLADPQLLNESLTALDELTRLLDLGNLYPFQQTNG